MVLLSNGVTSFSGGRITSNGMTNLWSGSDPDSQIPYDENSARNEAEEKEADAFWNLQASQDISLANNKKMRRATAR